MTDPAIDAAQRAGASGHALDPIAAAREALAPIKAEFGHLQRLARDVGPSSDLGRALQYALDRFAPLIYTAEELER